MQITVTVRHDVYFHPADGSTSARLQRIEEAVSQLSDRIANLTRSADAAISRVQSDVTKLRQQVDDLQAKVDQGGATAKDVADLEALQAKLDALDPVQDATLEDVPAPTPAPDQGTTTDQGATTDQDTASGVA